MKTRVVSVFDARANNWAFLILDSATGECLHRSSSCYVTRKAAEEHGLLFDKLYHAAA